MSLYDLWHRRRRKLKRGGDSTAPSLTGRTPAADAVNVEPSASISLTVADSESVVAIGTLDVTVDGVAAVTDGVVVAPFNGTGSSCTQVGNDAVIVLVPTNEFQYRAVVTVGVYATSSGGVLNTTYSFTVRDVTAMALFNGTDEYLNNSDGLSATIGGSSAMTISYWERNDADSSYCAISNSRQISENLFTVIGTNAANRMQIFIPSAKDSEADYCFAYAGDYNATQWNHVVVRFDGSQSDNPSRLRVWTNGIERTGALISHTGTIPAALPSGVVQACAIGRASGAASGYAAGLLGHVAVWNSALSTGDISTLFGDGRITNPRALASKPLHFWRCDSTDNYVDANGVVDRGSSATKRHMSGVNMDASNASANVPPQVRNVVSAYTWSVGHVGGDHTHSSWPASVGTLTLTPTGEANQWTQDVATPFMRASACPAGVHNEGLYRHASANIFQAARTYPTASIHVRHVGYVVSTEGTTSYPKWQWKKGAINDYVNVYYTSTSAWGVYSRHATADGGYFNGGGASAVTSSVLEPDALPRPVLMDAFYIYDPDADTWTMSLYVNGIACTKTTYSSVTAHPYAGDSMDYSIQGGLSGEYAFCGVWYREIADTYDPDAFAAEHRRDFYSLGG